MYELHLAYIVDQVTQYNTPQVSATLTFYISAGERNQGGATWLREIEAPS